MFSQLKKKVFFYKLVFSARAILSYIIIIVMKNIEREMANTIMMGRFYTL